MSSPIVTVPQEVLRQKSVAVGAFSHELREQVADLVGSLQGARDPEGVGLSFPQIGLSLRGFATYLDRKVRIYINPKILDKSEEHTLGGSAERPTLEGCLSIPHLYGPVWRPKKIKVLAYDEFGNEFVKTLSSFPARVFMHEYDHLDGVLFTDYTLKENLPLYFLDKEQDKFVEVKDPASVIKW